MRRQGSLSLVFGMLGLARTSPKHEHPDLTIGMATYDDFDGVYFTIQSLRLHHAEVMELSLIHI